MADEMNKERESFEAWHRTTNWPSDLGQHEGRYMSNIADASWQAWQARASLAASAGSEPVAEVMFADGKKYIQYTVPKELLAVGTKLYTHPSPPEGMVGGWRPIETAPKERGARFIGLTTTGRAVTAEPMYCVYDGPAEFRGWLEVERGSVVSVELKGWMPLHTHPIAAGGGREADHG